MQVSVGPKLFRAGGPKPLIGQGCLCIIFSPYGDLLVGGGDGSVNLIRLPSFKPVKNVKVQGHVTSIVAAEKGVKGSFDMYVGTSMANLYLVKYVSTQRFKTPMCCTYVFLEVVNKTCLIYVYVCMYAHYKHMKHGQLTCTIERLSCVIRKSANLSQ